jgi:NDP-sugar pyrophosphorylase family protein
MDSSPVFVMNGDTLQDFEPQEMEMRFQKSKAPVILVRKLAGHGKRYGGVVLGERRVSEFGSDAVTSEYINSGVYLLPRDEFDGYDAEAFSLEEDYFPHSVKSKQYEWVVDEGCNFVDIGVPEDYVSLRNRLESKQTDL